ncbi:MAG: DUF1232 domain-containing protein [Tissierellia bacterium]|nr:DUF1232 domain-containing protein [Tissierellia bacterium]MDD4045805.1 DUF1232 domain-containing protein [Tissierellia bacterium]
MGRILFIIKFLFDKNIPIREKWWVIIPVIYILSPADLIPEPVLGFGIVDDLVILGLLLTIVYDKIKKYYFDNRNKDKDIIENVEYEIDKDEEK